MTRVQMYDKGPNEAAAILGDGSLGDMKNDL
jgi:hypothetical protein